MSVVKITLKIRWIIHEPEKQGFVYATWYQESYNPEMLRITRSTKLELTFGSCDLIYSAFQLAVKSLTIKVVTSEIF